MIRSFLTATALATSLAMGATAQTAPPEVQNRLATPKLQGVATTRAWGFKLYDAQLWTDGGGAFSFGRKFALSLTYGTRFSDETLADSTIAEIVRVEGGSEASHQELRNKLVACLPTVRSGVRVTGVSESASRVSLYVNGKRACSIAYPNLRKRFFSIWLAPTSRDARAAAKLTGRG